MGVKIENAYILKSFTINEADKVIVVLNEKGEKLSLIAKNGVRIKSRFQGKLEPFSFVKLEYFDNGKSGLKPLNSVEVSKNLQSFIKGDMKKFLAFSFINEVIDAFVYEKEKNPRIFRLLKHVVDCLENGIALKNAITYFSLWILKLSGIMPEVNTPDFSDEEIKCVENILKNPLDKLECSISDKLFNFAIEQLISSSTKDFKSFVMLKDLI